MRQDYRGLRRELGWLGAVLFIVGWVLASTAVATPLYVPDGLDTQLAPLLQATIARLVERAPEFELVVVPLPSDTWMARIEGGVAGYALLDPTRLIQLQTRHTLRPLVAVARQVNGRPVGQTAAAVWSRAGGKYTSLDKADGCVIAVVEGELFTPWTAVEYELAQKGLSLRSVARRILRTDNDAASLQALMRGEADFAIVCAGSAETLANKGLLNLSDLRLVPLTDRAGASDYPFKVSTRLYPSCTLVALPGITEEAGRRLASVLLASAAEGALEANGLTWTVPRSLEESRVAMQELRMPPFQNYGRIPLGQILRQYMYWFIAGAIALALLGMFVSYIAALNRTLEREVEERKTAQASLKSSVERFEQMAECSGDWIWEADREQRITYSNRAVQALLGWKPSEVMGRPLIDFISTAEKERLQGRAYVVPPDERGIFRQRLTLVRSDGRVAIHDCTAMVIRDQEGRAVGYRGVNRDVTAEARLVSFRQ